MGIKELLEKYEKLPLEDILRQKYIDEDMTISQVAEELKVSVGQVHNWLSKYQITKQKKMWKN